MSILNIKEVKKQKNWFVRLITIILGISLFFNVYFVLDKYLYPSPLSLFFDRVGWDHPKHRVIYEINKDSINQLPDYKAVREYEIKGLVNSLDDAYSEYLNQEESDQLWDDLNQEYTGIGILVEFIENRIQIVRVFEGSGAYDAGLKTGDIILAIDKDDVPEKLDFASFSQIINRISGDDGSYVNLKILRNQLEFEKDIVRKDFIAPTVEYTIENNIAIVTIYGFGDRLKEEFSQVADILIENRIESMILDLRGNSGGLVDSAVELAEFFVPIDRLITKVEYRDRFSEYYSQKPDPILVDTNLIIIVDGYTASASELLALALKDNNNALIMGQTSFGKGTGQNLIMFEDNTTLKITTFRWFSPKGSSINGEGIQPDILVEPGEEIQTALDYFANK